MSSRNHPEKLYPSREEVGKKGVVKDINVHKKVIQKIVDFSKGIGFKVIGLDFSPIKGPEGNIEFLIYLSKNDLDIEQYDIDKVVQQAHEL